MSFCLTFSSLLLGSTDKPVAEAEVAAANGEVPPVGAVAVLPAPADEEGDVAANTPEPDAAVVVDVFVAAGVPDKEAAEEAGAPNTDPVVAVVVAVLPNNDSE